MSARFKFSAVNVSNHAINSSTARSMVSEYHNHSKRLKTTDGKTLNGLMVERETLVDLLNLNEADRYMIIFGISGDDISKPESDQDFTTMIAPVIDGNIQVNNIQNIFSPCPSDCADYCDAFNRPSSDCQ